MLGAARRGATARPSRSPETDSAPAERFRLPDGTVFGIISSTTAPFCRSCDRSRLTADGLWYLCLYAAKGINLREPLRAGASAEELAGADRVDLDRPRPIGEPRSGSPCGTGSPLARAETLRNDPHLEMHTRGG